MAALNGATGHGPVAEGPHPLCSADASLFALPEATLVAPARGRWPRGHSLFGPRALSVSAGPRVADGRAATCRCVFAALRAAHGPRPSPGCFACAPVCAEAPERFSRGSGNPLGGKVEMPSKSYDLIVTGTGSAAALQQSGWVLAELPLDRRSTVYGRIGDAWGWVCLLATSGLWVAAVVLHRRKANT